MSRTFKCIKDMYYSNTSKPELGFRKGKIYEVDRFGMAVDESGNDNFGFSDMNSEWVEKHFVELEA